MVAPNFSISCLTAGLSDLRTRADILLVPFEMQRITGARVLWLNKLWLQEKGVDVASKDVIDCIESWVIESFAFAIANSTNVSCEGESRVFFADRYGSTYERSPHGGSGRVATVDCFQIKGVGRTPLAGAGASLGHSHGCLSMSEAVREAILSEIARVEFPYGATPVIALIDTGLRYSSPDTSETYEQDATRVLLVRPAIFRLAHLQRAPSFNVGQPSYLGDQVADAERTRRVIHLWLLGELPEIPPIEQIFCRAAEQAAYGFVHGFFNGGYFSSNIGTSGALLDFGNAHVFNSWSCYRVVPRAPGFGEELRSLYSIIDSISFHAMRYGRINTDGWVSDLCKKALTAYKNRMSIEIENLAERHGLDSGSIRALMKKDRSNIVEMEHGRSVRATRRNSGYDFITSLLQRDVSQFEQCVPASCVPFGRHFLFRDTLLSELEILEDSIKSGADKKTVSSYIETKVEMALR